jgi:hypothetical protein
MTAGHPRHPEVHRLPPLRGRLPYDAIFFNEDLNLAQKCTGCAHLIDDGWAEPRCADACPTEALKMMEEDEAKELIAKGQAYAPKFGGDTKPRVYYIGLPKKFIGRAIEPAEEVLIGAAPHPGRQVLTTTDARRPGSKASTTVSTPWSSSTAAKSSRSDARHHGRHQPRRHTAGVNYSDDLSCA